jgi:TPR repeat protein
VNGQGVPKDLSKAAALFRLAADQNNGEAQYNLGVMYSLGQGVEQSFEEAVKWYRRGAANNDTNSQYNLGASYYNGQGVPQDVVRTYLWWCVAAINGDKNANEDRETLEKKMTPESFAEGKKLFKQCKENNYKNCD